jgi:hypothetical protein
MYPTYIWVSNKYPNYFAMVIAVVVIESVEHSVSKGQPQPGRYKLQADDL